MKVKLIQITRRDKVSSKTNKPYVSLLIKTQEHGDKFLSGFGNKDNSDWKEGDSVEITVTAVQKDGKEYLNFETPKKSDSSEEVLNALAGVNMKLDAIWSLLKGKTHVEPVEEEPSHEPAF